jgi:hypothetical protein
VEAIEDEWKHMNGGGILQKRRVALTGCDFTVRRNGDAHRAVGEVHEKYIQKERKGPDTVRSGQVAVRTGSLVKQMIV